MGNWITSIVNGKKVKPKKKKNEFSVIALAEKLKKQKEARKKLMDSMPK